MRVRSRGEKLRAGRRDHSAIVVDTDQLVSMDAEMCAWEHLTHFGPGQRIDARGIALRAYSNKVGLEGLAGALELFALGPAEYAAFDRLRSRDAGGHFSLTQDAPDRQRLRHDTAGQVEENRQLAIAHVIEKLLQSRRRTGIERAFRRDPFATVDPADVIVAGCNIDRQRCERRDRASDGRRAAMDFGRRGGRLRGG